MARRSAIWMLLASVACAACAPSRQPREPLREVCAPMPPCPSVVEAFRENRAPLHVYAFDAVSRSRACEPGGVVAVTVYIDDQPVGIGEIRCADELRVPPPGIRIDGKPVAAGLHELRVEVRNARGKMETSALMSLPAFDITMEGKALIVGAEISITVSAEEISIAPPQVYPPRGL